MVPEQPEPPTLYTIGHSNQAIEELLGLLRAQDIQLLVDVRSSPRSAYTPHFDREPLRRTLQEGGIGYLYRGDRLGGRPEGRQFYDERGYVRYDRMAETPAFQAALEGLQAEMAARRTAVLCSEEDPTGCHRRLLIGRVLSARGVRVLHIRGDGRLQTEEALRRAESGEEAGQPALFELEEVTPWRSTRSAIPARAPRRSSKR